MQGRTAGKAGLRLRVWPQWPQPSRVAVSCAHAMTKCLTFPAGREDTAALTALCWPSEDPKFCAAVGYSPYCRPWLGLQEPWRRQISTLHPQEGNPG